MNNSDHLSEALKHSCDNWISALSESSDDSHLQSYNIWDTFLFFFEMSLEFTTARTSNRARNGSDNLLLIGTSLFRYYYCKKIMTVSFVLNWDTGFGKKTIHSHIKIYIKSLQLNISRNINLAWLFYSFSLCHNIFFDKMLHEKLNIKNICKQRRSHWCIVLKSMKEWIKNRCYRTKKNPKLTGTNSSLETSFNVLTVSIAGSFLAIEIYSFTLAKTAS